MARQFQFAFVVIMVGDLHAFHVQVQTLTRQKPLIAAIPAVELDEGRGIEPV